MKYCRSNSVWAVFHHSIQDALRQQYSFCKQKMKLGKLHPRSNLPVYIYQDLKTAKRLFHTHLKLILDWKRKKNIIILKSFFWCEKILCTRSLGEIRWPATFSRASFIADMATWFKCVSILLKETFAKIRVSVTLFTCFCFFITILWFGLVFRQRMPCSTR